MGQTNGDGPQAPQINAPTIESPVGRGNGCEGRHGSQGKKDKTSSSTSSRTPEIAIPKACSLKSLELLEAARNHDKGLGEVCCRICLGSPEDDDPEDEENGGPIIRPCECGGSVGFIHEGCLLEWVSSPAYVSLIMSAKAEARRGGGNGGLSDAMLAHKLSRSSDSMGCLCELCHSPLAVKYVTKNISKWTVPKVVHYNFLYGKLLLIAAPVAAALLVCVVGFAVLPSLYTFPLPVVMVTFTLIGVVGGLVVISLGLGICLMFGAIKQVKSHNRQYAIDHTRVAQLKKERERRVLNKKRMSAVNLRKNEGCNIPDTPKMPKLSPRALRCSPPHSGTTSPIPHCHSAVSSPTSENFEVPNSALGRDSGNKGPCESSPLSPASPDLLRGQQPNNRSNNPLVLPRAAASAISPSEHLNNSISPKEKRAPRRSIALLSLELSELQSITPLGSSCSTPTDCEPSFLPGSHLLPQNVISSPQDTIPPMPSTPMVQ